ncbi:DUF1643 domain-containing protein [Wenxinia marina]|uniref:DUF1643 domain-containing protein n=1 Tax=Wenxinia marina DSM 24838 TaxID=1123501 RepID=A0A0D0PHH9_9RHOB|nr:DUF1643 domain-containing protein [Wenxinia marina]KIQ70816.1 hypothetical protein Wenmar_00190 [Wenxinia marina DSM 24838]GGL57063.1 hypothetical protein GCM10011392_09430 [Wenxinia marina]
MLNPATADAHRNDPTIARVEARTRLWGWPGFVVCNLFAFRATRPEALRQAADPVGPRTDRILRREVRGAGSVLCAWGVHGALAGRDAEVRTMLAGRDPLCLGLTKDGHPRHPLYLRADARPVPYQ